MKRIKYILKESLTSVLVFLIGSLVLTGFVLLAGFVFKQDWAFAPGILIVALLWNVIKNIYKAIKDSKHMRY
jgi:NADH:ubiquinone oxidoreductase subunit 5 (subunit L)/multisubunit Na+/H+ antiporter MnhA subunit